MQFGSEIEAVRSAVHREIMVLGEVTGKPPLAPEHTLCRLSRDDF
jgi:hypothetical protein